MDQQMPQVGQGRAERGCTQAAAVAYNGGLLATEYKLIEILYFIAA